jgi:hypothetical protein
MIHRHPIEFAPLDDLEIICAFSPKPLEVIRKGHEPRALLRLQCDFAHD